MSYMIETMRMTSDVWIVRSVDKYAFPHPKTIREFRVKKVRWRMARKYVMKYKLVELNVSGSDFEQIKPIYDQKEGLFHNLEEALGKAAIMAGYWSEGNL